ncbi:MAG: YIP1 family protein [Actinomycetota bacterium]|nr:YIP1 family protein [Actinomycetota bacterium]
MIRNAIRAISLDVDFYNAVEVDRSLTAQAGIVVVIASALNGVGSAVALDDVSIIAAVLGAMATGLVGWLLWSAAAYLIGTRVFGGATTFGAVLRVIGFTFAPLAFGVIPWLGVPAAGWMLVAAVIAFREGLNIGTKSAIGTMTLGWGLWLGTTLVLNVLLDLELSARWPFP